MNGLHRSCRSSLFITMHATATCANVRCPLPEAGALLILAGIKRVPDELSGECSSQAVEEKKSHR